MTNHTSQKERTMFDFGDGLVEAHQHPRGGGWVANTASVADTAYVGPKALVYDVAVVRDRARIKSNARVFGGAWVRDNAKVGGNARVYGNVIVEGNTLVDCQNLAFAIKKFFMNVIKAPLSALFYISKIVQRVKEA